MSKLCLPLALVLAHMPLALAAQEADARARLGRGRHNPPTRWRLPRRRRGANARIGPLQAARLSPPEASRYIGQNLDPQPVE
jgi:hypothetical protein